jgi:hypothetical protein
MEPSILRSWLANIPIIYLTDKYVIMRLDPGQYEVKSFNPRSREYSWSQIVSGSVWASASAEDEPDWLILLTRPPLQRELYPELMTKLASDMHKRDLISL